MVAAAVLLRTLLELRKGPQERQQVGGLKVLSCTEMVAMCLVAHVQHAQHARRSVS